MGVKTISRRPFNLPMRLCESPIFIFHPRFSTPQGGVGPSDPELDQDDGDDSVMMLVMLLMMLLLMIIYI